MADSRIRTLRNERSLGGYGAMNRAVRASTGDVVAIYHADDMYDQRIVEREVAYLSELPVPVYLGAPDIGDYVWPSCFIDRREFASCEELSRFLDELTPAQYQGYRDAARAYLESADYYRFTAGAFVDRFIDDIAAQLHERGMAALWD
ncbi:MAG: glycosyltransferase [Gemmatimonadaceae bacterium]